MKLISYEAIKRKMLKDPIMLAHYKALGPEFAIIKKRIAQKIKNAKKRK